MLQQIRIENFKAARSLDLRVAPLTVLSGVNSSGKSSVLQSLALLRQSSDVGTLRNGLSLFGSIVQLGYGIDVLNEHAENDVIVFDLTEDDQKFTFRCRAQKDSNSLEMLEPLDPTPKWLEQWFQFLRADRVGPDTVYARTVSRNADADFFGPRGEYTVDYLARCGTSEVSKRRACSLPEPKATAGLRQRLSPTNGLLDQTAAWLHEISPGVRATAALVELTDHVSLRFKYFGFEKDVGSREYRATNVGFGLTYVLPVVVAPLAAPKGALVLIENPEAHLHPRGQAVLGQLLAQCAADGVQILIETHSDHLLNGIRIAVKQSAISAEDVAIHYFSRELLSGESYVQSPAILHDGSISNWPDGFFDQWEKNLETLIG